MLQYASELIDVCLKNHEMNEVWKNIITKYNLLVAIMNTKENLTDEKIDEFHEITCDFYDLVCTKIGYHCITNYLHMLGAGHVEYYLRAYKNLWRYNQQGWESLNDKITTIFFYYSQKGGSEKQKPYLEAIAKMLQRGLL